ncbi:MAG: DNA polymerase IV [Bacillota bacterium]
MQRVILLADMNAFFASVHQALDPALKGKPVIVGGDPARRHGVVLTASYEAKARGVKTGMTVYEAEKLCPEGIFLKPQHHLYIHFSTRILRIMHDFTPLVEPFSIDEAFLDVTGCAKLLGPPREIARRLKERIRLEVGVTCSIGIGPNKLLAKMAAELEKPDGLTVLDHADVPKRLWPLPVRELFGVGPRYEHHLKLYNIHTIGDLARFPVKILKKRFGVNGEILWRCANGIDESPVDPDTLERAKSVGQQITLPRDYRTHEEMKVVILELADLVAQRAREGGYWGKTVVLSLKDAGFAWLSRMSTLAEYTDLAADICRAALALLKRHWPPGWPVRMIGVALAGLVPKRVEQPTLFGEKEKISSSERACDRIRSRFGERAVFRAVSLTKAGVRYA